MAGGQERALRRRIRSVQSTKKITRAMELIAASRIVKAQQRVAAARPYSEQITEVMKTLAQGAGAGAYNASVLRYAERAMTSVRDQGKEVALVTSGRKAQGYFHYRGYPIAEAY